MKILVTGGTGFIGSRLVKTLIERGYDVDVLTRKSDFLGNSTNNKCGIIQLDLLDSTVDLTQIVAKYSIIFNCAGELKNPKLMKSLHVDATQRLLNAFQVILNSDKNSVHWIQLSSVGSYGALENNFDSKRKITEDSQLRPIGEYEVTKTIADQIVMKAAANKNFTYTILRPSNVFGKGMPNNSVRQLAKAIERKVFFYIGKEKSISNYIHVDDVVDALLLCAFDSRAKNETLNISNDCELELIVNALAKALNVSKPSMRIWEKPIRVLTFLFSWIPWFPLTNSRINALLSRTEYPNDKITNLLGFIPARDSDKYIAEVLTKNI